MQHWLTKSTFCFLLLGSASFTVCAQSLLKPTHYKFKHTQRVFKTLNLAFQNGMNEPDLEVVDTDNLVLKYFSKPSPTLRLSEGVYNLCMTFGADSSNALATLLSHELVHHYERHQGHAHYDTKNTLSANELTQSAYYELDADTKGCFYSFLSGFDTHNIFENVLNKVYMHFKLPDKLNGYPTRQERITNIRKQSADIQGNAIVFTAGQFLYAAQNFVAATACFEFLQRFPCGEVLNNTGASALQAALSMTNPNELPFMLPVETKPRNRFLVKNNWTNSKQIYVSKAINALERLQRIKPNEASTVLNLAIAYILDNKLELALAQLEQGMAAQKKPNPNFYTLKAVVYFLKKDYDSAEDNFIKAQTRGAYMAEHNAKVFQKYNKNAFSGFIDWLAEWFEEVDAPQKQNGVRFPEELSRQAIPPKQTTLFLKVSEKPYVKILYNADWHSKGVMILQTERIDYTLLFDKTLQSAASAKYLRYGSTKTDIQAVCGSSFLEMELAGGSLWAYPNAQLVCLFNDKNRLFAWFIASRSVKF